MRLLVLGALAILLAPSARSPAPGCTPHPGLGSVTLARGEVVDLATCHVRTVHVRTPAGLVAPGGAVATVRATGSRRTLRSTIWVTQPGGASHAVFSAKVWGDTAGRDSNGPIELLGFSDDARWVFFAIDPGSSSSIAADGLLLQVVSAAGGRPHRLGIMLPYRDYLTWCGRRLVFTAGEDRIAIHAKRLLTAAPPAWRPRPLVEQPGESFGSLACDGDSVIVQSQPSSTDAGFFATRWALWKVGLDGSHRALTAPARRSTDESPLVTRDGQTVLFVRSHSGHGELYALRNGHAIGPLLSLGFQLGFYGHRNWWAP